MKIIDDTLKSPDGKWSRKSLTMLSSFVIAVILGAYIVTSDFFIAKEINRYAVDVFNGFLLLVAALTGATVADKFTPKKQEQKTEQ